MSVNPNGEAEVLKVYFKPRPRLKKLIVDLDFSDLMIKGRQSQGNLFTRYAIHKIVLKEKGVSTLGGHNIWFDEDIQKLNTDGRGKLLGEFQGNDKTVVFTKSGSYYTAGYDVSLYFPEDLLFIEKYDSGRVYSVIYFDAEQNYYYLKRFVAEEGDRAQNFVDEAEGDKLIAITADKFPQLKVVYTEKHASRSEELIVVVQFIGVKGYKAKGKRITTYAVSSLSFVEPLEKEVPQAEEDGMEEKEAVAAINEGEVGEEPFAKQMELFDDM